LALTMAAVALAPVLFAAPSRSALAEDWPTRPITLVVPIAAGGGTDIMGRAVAAKLAPVLGQPIVVKNMAGANGSIGTSFVARAPADGYTVLVGSIGTHAANVCLYKLPYDAAKDFTPVGLLAKYNDVVTVRADSPIKSLADLVKRAKANPGKLTYAITVVGSSAHLALERFKATAGIDMLGIPYNGAVPATVDVLGGRVDFMLDTVVSQYANLKSGKARALATTIKDARSPVLPDVPTVAEQGYPDYDVAGWTGLFVRSGTPDAIVQKIAAALRATYATGELQKLFGAQGLDVTTTTQREFAAFVDKERKSWCDVIHAAHIKVDD
jgi:tripartite-type tricarboxylate transporter receptor subunit TctC